MTPSPIPEDRKSSGGGDHSLTSQLYLVARGHLFAAALDVAVEGYATWATKPHNARWVRKVAGTPIPNDVKVCIAEALVPLLAALSKASRNTDAL